MLCAQKKSDYVPKKNLIFNLENAIWSRLNFLSKNISIMRNAKIFQWRLCYATLICLNIYDVILKMMQNMKSKQCGTMNNLISQEEEPQVGQ